MFVLADARFTGLKSCVPVRNKTLPKVSIREASREFAHVHKHIPTPTHKFIQEHRISTEPTSTYSLLSHKYLTFLLREREKKSLNSELTSAAEVSLSEHVCWKHVMAAPHCLTYTTAGDVSSASACAARGEESSLKLLLGFK